MEGHYRLSDCSHVTTIFMSFSSYLNFAYQFKILLSYCYRIASVKPNHLSFHPPARPNTPSQEQPSLSPFRYLVGFDRQKVDRMAAYHF